MSKQDTVEIPILKEDYDKLTTEVEKLGFKDLNEFAEKATRKYLEHLQQQRKDGMVVVRLEFEIAKYALDFLKEYVALVVPSSTVEDICRQMIYQNIGTLVNHIQGLPFFDGQKFLDKYPYALLLTDTDETEETDC